MPHYLKNMNRIQMTDHIWPLILQTAADGAICKWKLCKLCKASEDSPQFYMFHITEFNFHSTLAKQAPDQYLFTFLVVKTPAIFFAPALNQPVLWATRKLHFKYNGYRQVPTYIYINYLIEMQKVWAGKLIIYPKTYNV